MPTEVVQAEQTWRVLWFDAARKIIASTARRDGYEIVNIGCAWGISNRNNGCALLLHPTGENRALGDLSLTVRGLGTQMIPRANSHYVDYLDMVSDVVETVARVHLQG